MQGVTGRGKVRVKHLVVILTIWQVLLGHIQDFERGGGGGGVPSGNFPQVEFVHKGGGGRDLLELPLYLLFLLFCLFGGGDRLVLTQ